MSNKTKKAQVVVAALDAQNQSFLFLILQTNQKRGEFWQNVTGKVEGEESFEEGAIREVIEETGLPVDIVVDMMDLELRHDFIDQRKRPVHEQSFLLVTEKPWEVVIDPKEHQAYQWIDLKKINRDSVKFEGNYEALVKAREILRHWRM